MFTVGIFTTHIPYIAFVVFYAFFFLFGVNTPVQEEVQADNSKFNIELHTTQLLAVANTSSSFHYQTDLDFLKYKNLEDSIFKRKIYHQCSLKTLHWHYFFNNSLSNRPPPVSI